MQIIISNGPFSSYIAHRKYEAKITLEPTQATSHHYTVYMEGIMWWGHYTFSSKFCI